MSFSFAEHELEVEEVALALGFTNISLSHRIMEMIKIVPRGHTGLILKSFLLLYLLYNVTTIRL